MGFFERNRRQLEELGYDPARLPPGQYLTQRFPVLQVGAVPAYPDLRTWDLRIFGAVEREMSLSWDDLVAMPPVSVTLDIHCVTKWSKFDSRWQGVRVRDLLERAGPRSAATHVLAHGDPGYSTNLPLPVALDDDAIVAYNYEGEPLDPEHGYPARLVVPGLYFWKSAKWLRGLELLEADTPGFWERNGYHMAGDPWQEQRFDGR